VFASQKVVGTMNWGMQMAGGLRVVALVGIVACSSSSSSGPPTPFGNWIYTNAANTAGVGITINENGTYSVLGLTLTSATTANSTEEIGSVVVTPNTISFTPQQSTCSAADPPYSATYSVTATTLDLSFPTVTLALHSNTAPASSDFVLTLGCDDTSGTFVPQALAPVTP
jgi:hypothetical protein